MNRPIWFKAKTYGWGWYPATWQGWLIIIVYIGLVAYISKDVTEKVSSANEVLLYVSLPIIILTAVLVLVSYLFGEKPGWRWPKN